MSRSRSKLPQILELDIHDLSHDGRGVSRNAEGKAVFVEGALPGERVRAERTGRNRHFDEARTLDVLQASPDRIEPRCPHFLVCSGCVLQHLREEKQIEAKQRTLLDNLRRIGHVEPGRVLPPLTDAAWGYRRKGRFSVRYVEKKGKTVVGFRESNPRFVADLSQCHTVLPEISLAIPELSALVDGLDGRRSIPQIEFIAGDEGVAFVFRHLEPLSGTDLDKLRDYARGSGHAVFLQPGGVDSVQPLWPEQFPLSFALPEWDVRLAFRPLDFIQVNAGLNHRMIRLALELLDPQPQDRVLDLFCGLGNFTLPLARKAGSVVGVEGEAGLVQRARDNARRNGLDARTEFHAADLAQDLSKHDWARQRYDAVLVDPPRTGAQAMLEQLRFPDARRLLYVSCHPGSLARDARILVDRHGFRLAAAGVMDMFPHTAHVESIAVFEPG